MIEVVRVSTTFPLRWSFVVVSLALKSFFDQLLNLSTQLFSEFSIWTCYISVQMMCICLWMHTDYLRNCDRTFFFSCLPTDLLKVSSGVSVYLATVQYIVHSLSKGQALTTWQKNRKKTANTVWAVSGNMFENLPFKALPLDFMDGPSGNAMKFIHWIMLRHRLCCMLVTFYLWAVREKAKKSLKANWNFFSAPQMHLNEGQWQENKKEMYMDHRKRTK